MESTRLPAWLVAGLLVLLPIGDPGAEEIPSTAAAVPVATPAKNKPPAKQKPRGVKPTAGKLRKPKTPVPPGPPVVYPDEPDGHDFIAEARLLFRVAACAGEEPLPSGMDAGVVGEHCNLLRSRMEWYRDSYVPRVRAMLSSLEPGAIPDVVVYPFGGGDLVGALSTFPEAREITTLSLEHAADPRRLAGTKRRTLRDGLKFLRQKIAGLLQFSDSKTSSLMQLQRGRIAGQLSFFMVGLAIHGMEPVSVRYFRINPDGGLHYFSLAEVDSLARARARKLRTAWVNPDFSSAFSNVEIRFRPHGAPAESPLRVHRHIATDLSDGGLDVSLVAYLETRGRVAAMTKAASYLLWSKQFSKIRDYLLAHMEYMVSDSTGLPPALARAAGFEQVPVGRFAGSFLRASPKINAEFVKLWKSQPLRAQNFRYGYLDAKRHHHLLITRRPKREGS